MIDIRVKDNEIRKAVGEGMDSFVQVFINAINTAIGGQLTQETMSQLNYVVRLELSTSRSDGGRIYPINI